MKHNKINKFKKGNIGMVCLVILLIVTSIIMLIDTYERRTLYLKRQNLQNVLTSANLSLYDAVEQGDYKTLVPIKPGTTNQQMASEYGVDTVVKFLSAIDTANDEQAINNLHLDATTLRNLKNDYLNLSAISYLEPTATKDYRYKCVYINKNTALAAFENYLENKLNVHDVLGYDKMLYKANDETKFIEEIVINEFYVRNAVRNWDETVTGNCCDYVANSEQTAIHIDMTIKIRTFTHLDMIKSGFKYSAYTEMPMHIDTLIDFNNI